MEESKKLSPEDVSERFYALPEDLEVVIDNKKLGIPNLDHSRWDKCDVEALEKGLAIIKDKRKFLLYRNIGESLLSLAFIALEIFIVANDLQKHSPAFIATVVANLKLIFIVSIPLLITKEIMLGDSSLLAEDEDDNELKNGKTTGSIAIVRREVRIIIAIIIFLDLINLFVGA